MNIALSSLIILFLLLPGVFFRAFVIKSDGLENPLDTSIKTELGIIFLFSLIFQLIGYYFITIFLDYEIFFDQIYYIIKGDSKLLNQGVLDYSTIRFLLYTSSLTILSTFAAIGIKTIIIKNYFDIRTNFLPISNEWDNLLSGRIYEYDRILKINNDIKDVRKFSKKLIADIIQKNTTTKKKIEEVKSVISNYFGIKKELSKLKKTPDYNYVELDVLVSTSGNDMIYKGRVYKYYLAKDNTLDKIILKDAFRRKFIDRKKKKHENLEFYAFESKLFVIKYSEIKNLNVRFTYLEKEDDSKEYKKAHNKS